MFQLTFYPLQERLTATINNVQRFQIQYRYTSDTEVILILIQVSSHDTVQIRSRHGFHSVTYSDFPQLRYAPDTVAILSLIQIQVQIHSRHESHFVTYSISRYEESTYPKQQSRIYFPQQYNKSAYMRIHYIHIS